MSCPPELNKLLRYMVQLTRMQGRLSPNNHGAPPILTTPPLFRHASSPPTPPPQTIFGHFIRNFVQFYARFQ